MHHLANGVIARALIVGCLAFDATHSQTGPAIKSDTGTVSGRVTLKGKGVPGIVVGLRRGESYQRLRATLKGTTDQDGKYRIRNVPAGTYQVAPIAPAFVSPDFSNSGSGSKALLIAEGEAVEDFDFALVRGGVITGNVTDPEGRPVIEEQVNLVIENQSTSLPLGARVRMQGIVVQTDDRGVYRAFGLPPGQYQVSAGQGEESFSGGGRRAEYRRTFYPSTTDPAKTTVVEVAEATERTDVDIVVVRMAAGVSASGRVVDSKNGEPVANLPLLITKTTVQGNSTYSSTSDISSTNMKGEFRAQSLTPGKYVVSLGHHGKNLRADPVTFDVLDQDVTGLLVKTSVGASLNGIVVLEGSLQNTSLKKFAPLFISVFVRDERPQERSARQSVVSPDGGFQLTGLHAGTLHLSLGSGNQHGRGIVVSRIERDGIVQPDGIQIQNGEQVGGVRVIVTHSTGAIRGRVTIENGPLPPTGRLFVRISKLDDQSNMMAPDLDARGHFIAESLTPGSYEIMVTMYPAPGTRQMPPSNKQIVTVADGAVSEVTITVDLNQNQRPTP